MLFETCGDPARPAVLFFRAMGVTGASSEPVARALQLTDRLADQPFPALPEALQRQSFWAFGSAGEHLKYREAVRRVYPQGMKDGCKEWPIPGESLFSYRGKLLPYMPFCYQHPQYWHVIDAETKRTGDMLNSRKLFDDSEATHPIEEAAVCEHGTHFVFPEGMLKTMLPVGALACGAHFTLTKDGAEPYDRGRQGRKAGKVRFKR